MKSLTKTVDKTSRGISTMRQIAMDVLSLVTSTGKAVATLTHNKVEFRDVKVIAPYGIASSGIEGMQAQIVCNDANNSVSMVGVYDTSKPDVGPGEVILYANFGQRIRMLSDGEIMFINKDGKQITLTQIVDHINAV